MLSNVKIKRDIYYAQRKIYLLEHQVQVGAEETKKTDTTVRVSYAYLKTVCLPCPLAGAGM